MEPARPKKNLTPKALAIWTAVATVFLGLTVWAITTRSVDALTGTIFFFLPTVIVAFCLSWTGQWRRLLPGVLATSIVAIWPIYRWVALGDWRPVSVFLGIAGFFNALLFTIAAFEFARRRGWVVRSKRRTQIMMVLILANAAVTVTKWPTGKSHYVFDAVVAAAFLLTLFWPPRRHAVQA